VGQSFTIGGVSFTALTMAAGRYAKSFSPGSAKTDLQRYHLRNCQGNLLGIGQTVEVPITCGVRYVDTLANVEAARKSDVTAWQNPDADGITISCQGSTYTLCRLKDEGARITQDPKATGRGEGLVYMDVEYSFISDAG
jgi:hypothetical protein